MKKRILSIIVFMLIFAAGWKYLNHVFRTQHIYENAIEDFRKLADATNVDVVFYGSSHAFTAYNPLIINEHCQTISYNLGSDAQRLPTSNFLLKETYKYTKPELVVLEVYWASMKLPEDEKIRGYQLRALDFIPPYSINRLAAIKYLYDKEDYLNAQFPLIRNHANWSTIKFTELSKRINIKKEKGLYYDGYIGFKEMISAADKEKFKDFKKPLARKNTKKRDISKADKNEFAKFVKIAKKGNSKILIISSPDLRARLFLGYFDQLSTLSDSLDVPFLNLNEYYDDIGLSVNDFKDKSHLNLKGGNKTTTFLAKYIDQNFELPNRKSEAIWNKKSEDYKSFVKQYPDINFKKVVRNSSFELLKDIVFKKVSVSQKNDGFFVDIELANTEKTLEVLKKYKIAVNIYPADDELDRLSSYSKSKGRDFESADIIIEEYSDSINKEMKAKFKKIKKIKMFLYDKTGYNGIVGKPLVIENPVIE